MNRRFSLQSRKKSQTLPASIKPSNFKKKSKASHLSPLANRKDGKNSSPLLGTSRPSTPNIGGRSSTLPLASPSSPMAAASGMGSSFPNQSPAVVSASTVASPAVSANKLKDAASGSGSQEENIDESIDVVIPSSNGNEVMETLPAQSGLSEVGDSGSANSIDRTKVAIEQLQQKISRTKGMIKVEQTSRDENVDEYLKLAGGCSDKQQSQRIKSVFEKKNQKSAQMILQLQKKLDSYTKRIHDLETHGSSASHHRQPKEVLRDVSQGLRDVGANIRDGFSGFSGGVVGNIKGGLSGLSAATYTAAETVMSKPREFAHLIKNKFGSADNINTMTKSEDVVAAEDIEQNHHGSATFTHSTKYTSDDECSSITSGSAGPVVAVPTNSTSPGHQIIVSATSEANKNTSLTNTGLPQMSPGSPIAHYQPDNEMLIRLWSEIHDRREDGQRLSEELETFKAQVQHDYVLFNQALQDERYRYERLEEQMNDLTELHQNEIENLKTGITDMEEKVQYQSEERLNDVHESLESCQTRISRMEHQQHQHQQLVSIEGIENSNARALVLKLINILLAVLQVVLLLVTTGANIIMPFLKTRVRTLTTIMLVVSVVLVCRQWTELVNVGRRLYSS